MVYHAGSRGDTHAYERAGTGRTVVRRARGGELVWETVSRAEDGRWRPLLAGGDDGGASYTPARYQSDGGKYRDWETGGGQDQRPWTLRAAQAAHHRSLPCRCRQYWDSAGRDETGARGRDRKGPQASARRRDLL